MINPELKIGDRIVLLHMDDETSVSIGEKGTVTGKSVIFGDEQYSVDWDNGSKLALISSCDSWTTVEDFERRRGKKKISENKTSDITDLMFSNLNTFIHFDMSFLNKYLKMVRESGITNMFGAAPYLYIGREKIEQEMTYKDLEGEQYDEMLENADKARDLMIQGTIKFLEKNGKEVSTENVKKYIRNIAPNILKFYIFLH